MAGRSSVASIRNGPNERSPDGVAVSSSTTDMNVLKYSHTWTINNFNFSLKPGTEINSPIFYSDIYEKIKWRMTICPGGKDEQKKSHLAIYLKLVSSYKNEIDVKYKFSVINDKREKTNLRGNSVPQTFLQREDNDEPKYGIDDWLPRWYVENEVNGLLPNDALTILCEISATTVIPRTSTSNGYDSQTVPFMCKSIKFSYTWKISDFHRLIKNNTATSGTSNCIVESPIFMVEAVSELKWILRLYKEIESPGNYYQKTYLKADLNLESSIKHAMKVTVQCHIVGFEAEKVIETGPKTFELTSENQNGSMKLGRLMCLDSLLGTTSTAPFVIICDLSYKPFLIINAIDGLLPAMATCALANNLESLFETKTFSDVALVVGERELPAHKNILAARSSVFAAMFEHDMQDRRENRVTIIDIDYEVVKEMLRFTYTDKVENVGEMPIPLLMAANKYGLVKLKIACEMELCLKIDTNNALDMLILADEHNAYHLRSRTINFIRTRGKEVINGERANELRVSHPQLLAEVVLQNLWSPRT